MKIIYTIIALFTINMMTAQEQIVDRQLKPYVLDYLTEIKKSWDVSSLWENDFIVIFDTQVEEALDFKGYTMKSEILGMAHGMNEAFVMVIINKANWNDLTRYEKADLINHELMHDVFNYEHVDEAHEGHLMHPSSIADSDTDAKDRFERALNSLQ